MNRKQRMRNRTTAKALSNNAVVCERCGERGKHFITTSPITLVDIIAAQMQVNATGENLTLRAEGFWICPDLYGPDGRRLEELPISQEPDHASVEHPHQTRAEERAE